MQSYIVKRPYYMAGILYQPGETITVPDGTPVSKVWDAIPAPTPAPVPEVEPTLAEEKPSRWRKGRPSDMDPGSNA
jgi:hypothetical protein